MKGEKKKKNRAQWRELSYKKKRGEDEVRKDGKRAKKEDSRRG